MQDARLLVAQETARWTATVGVEVRWATIDHASAVRLSSLPFDVSELAQRCDGRALGAVRLGDSLSLVAGIESAYLLDYDLEIAQAAEASDPVIATMTNGVSLWCLPSRTTTGDISAWCEFEYSQLLGMDSATAVMPYNRVDPEDMSPESRNVRGLIELPRVTRASIRETMRTRPDAWQLLGVRTLTGTERALVAVARFSWLHEP